MTFSMNQKVSEDDLRKSSDSSDIGRDHSFSGICIGQPRGSSIDSVVCRICQSSSDEIRYGCFESILVWYRNPDNRNLLMSDLLIYSILSFVCFMLTLVCMLVLRFQHSEHDPFGEELAKVAMIAYSANVIIIARDHLLPWY
uniref:Uncharacterized protein n=1 Tax=Anopheles epiroticus TaxID=199890 RepID=A0A182PYP1_9DIPT